MTRMQIVVGVGFAAFSALVLPPSVDGIQAAGSA